MAAEDETLFTFIVDFSRPATLVSVLGSWDNFQRSYPLKKEIRGGRETWRRYSDFSAVVCDGDCLKGPEEGRDGSLRMGGTYWYYYQVDNEGEFCDPCKPTTRTCPFLPGQEVNILEVPINISEHPAFRDSATTPTPYTLDPQDKFRPPSVKDRMKPQVEGKTRAASAKGPAKTVNSIKRLFSARGGPRDEEDEATDRKRLRRPSTMNALSRPSIGSDYLSKRSQTSAGPDRSGRMSSWQQLMSFTIPGNLPWNKPTEKTLPIELSADAQGTDRPPTDFLSQPRTSSRPGSSLRLEFRGHEGTDFAYSMLETGFLSKSASKRKGQTISPSQTGRDGQATKLGHSNTTSTRSSTFYFGVDLTHGHTNADRSSQPTTPSSGAFSFKFGQTLPKFPGCVELEGDWPNNEGNQSVLTLQNVTKLADDSKPVQEGLSQLGRVEEWNSMVEGSNAEMEESSTEMKKICDEMGYLCPFIS